MNANAEYYVEKLQLEKHPEGGYYKEIYRSDEIILPNDLPGRYDKPRVFSTSIYFLLEGKQVSKFHRLQSDEIWHFYDGSSTIIYIIDSKGEIKKERLGNDAGKENQFQITIERNNWFAAELEEKDSFALVGCTVAPGFEFADFEIAKRNDLVKRYPRHKEIIERLSSG